MAQDRMDKINELVRHEISKIIFEIFPDEFISVTQVIVSKDLSFAKIWISSFKDIDNKVKECQKSSSEMRQILAKNLILRRVPKLHFVADKTGESADKIEKLLKEIKDEKTDA